MRKRIFFILIILALVVLAISGCLSNTQASIKAILGKEFILPVGETAVINSEKVGIKFEAVTTDSRCPEGATCIWAGEAKSQIIIYSLQNPPLILALIELKESAVTQDYSQSTINLDWENIQKQYIIYHRLEPYPKVGNQINPVDYQLVLKITIP